MGDIEATKNKAKSISQGLQNEIQEYQNLQVVQSPPKYKNNHHNHNGNMNNGINPNGNINNGSNHNHGSAIKNGNQNSGRKERKITKRQLFTPQNTHSHNFSPVQKENSPNTDSPDESAFFNFIAPSWANFKFDRRAILDCLT